MLNQDNKEQLSTKWK